MNKVIETIKSRKSVRKYNDRQVEKDKLDAILEASMYAPSAQNHQSWHYTVIQNKELLEKLNSVIKEISKNSPYEKVRKLVSLENFNVFYGAPTVVIVSYDESGLMPTTDIALSSQNIMLAAESLGIGTCWNGFISQLFMSELADEYKELLGIPEGFTPSHGIVMGYTDIKSSNRQARKENKINYIG